MGIYDVNAFLAELKKPKDDGGYGLTTGLKGYITNLRPFFRWLDSHDEYGEYPWYEELNPNSVDFKPPSERRFPTDGEIKRMVEAARTAQKPRDVAILEFWRESAVRVTLGAQLTLGDVDLSDEPSFTPNPDGESQKGVEIKPYKLYDGVAALRVWINQYHPENRRDGPRRDEAPLWPDTREYSEWVDDDGNVRCQGYDYDDPQSSALRVNRINQIVKSYGEMAGLDDDVELKPHAFRHAAVGRWKERGYSLPFVQRRVAWSDEAAAQMWAKYGHPDDERIDAEIAKLEGREVPDEEEEEESEPSYSCGHCPDMEDLQSDHCPSCGRPVSPEAIEEAEEEARDYDEMKERLDELEARLEEQMKMDQHYG